MAFLFFIQSGEFHLLIKKSGVRFGFTLMLKFIFSMLCTIISYFLSKNDLISKVSTKIIIVLAMGLLLGYLLYFVCFYGVSLSNKLLYINTIRQVENSDIENRKITNHFHFSYFILFLPVLVGCLPDFSFNLKQKMPLLYFTGLEYFFSFFAAFMWLSINEELFMRLFAEKFSNDQ